mgnify:CR=1 FL=1
MPPGPWPRRWLRRWRRSISSFFVVAGLESWRKAPPSPSRKKAEGALSPSRSTPAFRKKEQRKGRGSLKKRERRKSNPALKGKKEKRKSKARKPGERRQCSAAAGGRSTLALFFLSLFFPSLSLTSKKNKSSLSHGSERFCSSFECRRELQRVLLSLRSSEQGKDRESKEKEDLEAKDFSFVASPFNQFPPPPSFDSSRRHSGEWLFSAFFLSLCLAKNAIQTIVTC